MSCFEKSQHVYEAPVILQGTLLTEGRNPAIMLEQLNEACNGGKFTEFVDSLLIDDLTCYLVERGRRGGSVYANSLLHIVCERHELDFLLAIEAKFKDHPDFPKTIRVLNSSWQSLVYACCRGPPDSKVVDMIALLKRYNCSISIPEKHGYLPLHAAAQWQEDHRLVLLLAGENGNLINARVQTYLGYAVGKTPLDLCKSDSIRTELMRWNAE